MGVVVGLWSHCGLCHSFHLKGRTSQTLPLLQSGVPSPNLAMQAQYSQSQSTQQVGPFDTARIAPPCLDMPWPSKKGARASQRRVLSQVMEAGREQVKVAAVPMPLGSNYTGSQVSFPSA